VVQGGMTGLAGGAHPRAGEIALSLERLRGVEEVDAASGTLTALAGTPLAEVQAAAEAAGLLCGIDLGARGSCTIGGNVATNAGGNQVLRYGMARRNVLGLEVVQPDGTVVRSLNKMLKNNAGYDWTQLFIGSEGTLGVITRVVLGLHPRPEGIETALVAVPGMDAALALLRALERGFGGGLLTFEGMWSEFLGIAVERLDRPEPFDTRPEIAVLIEVATGPGPGGRDRLADALGALMQDGTVADAIVAQSSQDRARLWSYRESPYDYGRLKRRMANFDVSVPRDRIGAAVAALRDLAAGAWPGAVQGIFGHVADSNLHVIVALGEGDPEVAAVERAVYGVIADFAGSISAEHGIGVSKRAYLPLSRSAPELALMRSLKAALDPAGILNPGRVLG
jgi:FAD/FMN-containing dehydrogenase